MVTTISPSLVHFMLWHGKRSDLDDLKSNGLETISIQVINFEYRSFKSNRSYLRPSKSSFDPVVVMKFEFCAHSARLLRKLDHVFLWILNNNTGL